jgi:hypothetical protein
MKSTILRSITTVFIIAVSTIMVSFIPSETAYAATSHCGTISSNEVWSSGGNVHTVGVGCDNVLVDVGVTLTIEQGAIVKFAINKSLIVNGTLRVLGTASNPVYLTSYRDDTIGGDTNGDGSATLPDRGDWDRIQFNDSSDDANSLIDRAIIRYGGDGSWGWGGVSLEGASPTIQNSAITDNNYCAIEADLRSFPTLTNNTYASNTINGLCYSGGTINSDSTWNMTDTSYFLRDNVTVSVGSTLTIPQDVIVKFNLNKSLIVSGAFRVEGTASNSVYLTSYRDDTVGGDTNGDGSATLPARGNWDRIQFTEFSDGANSLIDHAIIRYGGDGSWGWGGVSLEGASPTIQNSGITDNNYCAIEADLRSFPTLTNNTYASNTINGLCYSGGTINSDSTWNMTDTSYFLRDNVTVSFGSTLTIPQGVIVKFNLNKSLIVSGALRVEGTASNLVYLTSYRDDTVGGDTNGDGSATLPDGGNWDRIQFTEFSDGANSLIDHAIIRYGGDGSWGWGGITLEGASPTIQNSAITDNNYCAIEADLRSFPTLTNNTYIDNTINGLCYSGGTIDSDSTWDMTDTSYFLRDNVTVSFGSTLTIPEGVIVKFNLNKSLIVSGALRVEGTASNLVYLTSYRDDTVGGDTNGDGSATLPARGNWDRIQFSDSSDDANSLIDHAIIRYGGDGSWDWGGITIQDASPAIKNTTVVNNNYAGIRLNNSSPVIQNSKITNNHNAGIISSSSTPTLLCNDIFDNVSYGINNTTPGTIVSAENQWWGSASGPYHPNLNPTGAGNEVTDGVDFDPWESQSCITVVLDTEAPEVSWVKPCLDGCIYPVGGETILLEADAVDDVAVSYVIFYRWDAVNEQFVDICTDSTSPYQCYLDTSVLNHEWNQINITAYDTSGNSSNSPFIWLYLNYLPYIPSNPSPPSGSIDQPLDLNICWVGGDPDGDSVTYDVYFEPNDPAADVRVSQGQSSTCYDPGTLSPSTKYYWKIVPKDGHGASPPIDDVDVWNFSTASAPNGDVVLAVKPAFSTAAVGQTFDIILEVQAGAQQVDGAAAYLNFDPNYLQVAGVTPGSSLPTVLENTFNNTSGHVDFAAGAFSNFPSGTFTLATITFSANVQTSATDLTYNSVEPRKSDVTFGGGSVLTYTENGTVEVIPGAYINGSITLQGRPTPPNQRWITPLDVSLTVQGDGQPAYTFSPITDSSGKFTLNNITPGTYIARIKNSHTLRNTKTITLSAGPNNIDFGTLREGDANDDNFVTILDFSVLVSTYGKCQGDTGYDDRADFNEDNCVTLLDFSLLATNFGMGGDTLLSESVENHNKQDNLQGEVLLEITPDTTEVNVGDVFTITVQVQAGSQSVDGAQASIDFDSTKLQVKQVIGNSTDLPLTLLSQYDNTGGTLDYAAGALSNFPSGTFNLVQIHFEAIAQTSDTSLAFHFGNPRNTDATFGGESVLGGTSDGTVIVEEGVQDTPITGLSVTNNSPTVLNQTTTLTATISSGTNVIYDWDFGDGTIGQGQVVTHTYPQVGVYTATINVHNSVSSISDTTKVTITDLASTKIFLPLLIK